MDYTFEKKLHSTLFKVKGFFSILSAPLEDEDVEKELLCMVSNLWVTIRGFSYASAWKEQNYTEIKRFKKNTIAKVIH